MYTQSVARISRHTVCLLIDLLPITHTSICSYHRTLLLLPFVLSSDPTPRFLPYNVFNLPPRHIRSWRKPAVYGVRVVTDAIGAPVSEGADILKVPSNSAPIRACDENLCPSRPVSAFRRGRVFL